MTSPEPTSGISLEQAARLAQNGQIRQARQALREILAADPENAAAWELLSRAAQNAEEEVVCLKKLLALQPDHAEAASRLQALQDTPVATPSGGVRQRKSQLPGFLLGLAILALFCVGLSALAYFTSRPQTNQENKTQTAVAARSEKCQRLINQALLSSDTACASMNPNMGCYGHNTLRVEFKPGFGNAFEKQGDLFRIGDLSKLSASPLKPESQEWGIAIFRLAANLPNSLPGKAVTMMVFGNTSLENASEDLQAFYFSSEMGQLLCEQVPFDGLTLDVPDGDGVRFVINGSDLTLMGDASITAAANDQMQINLYNGIASVIADGVEQVFGAGQTVKIPLGGPSGRDPVGPPSTPAPMPTSASQLNCTFTGNCNTGTPRATSSLNQETLSAMKTPPPTITPTLTSSPTRKPTATPSNTPTATFTRTNTYTPSVIPTRTITRTPTITLTRTPRKTHTPSNTPSFTPLPTITPTRTRTPTRTPTFTKTRTPTKTQTPSLTASPSLTVSPSATLTPSLTPSASVTPSPSPTETPTSTATHSPSPTSTETPTATPTATATNTPVTPVACGGNIVASALIPSGIDELSTTIQNNTGASITIEEVVMSWVYSPSQKLKEAWLDLVLIWNKVDNSPPSEMPLEQAWEPLANRTIMDGNTSSLKFIFQEAPIAGLHTAKITFDTNCYVESTITIP